MTTNCWYDMNIQEQTRQHNIDLEILHDVITLLKKTWAWEEIHIIDTTTN